MRKMLFSFSLVRTSTIRFRIKVGMLGCREQRTQRSGGGMQRGKLQRLEKLPRPGQRQRREICCEFYLFIFIQS